MRGGRADAPGDGLEALLDVDHQAPFDRRDTNPFPILVKDLQTTGIVLRQKREQASRVLMGADALGIGIGWRISHKLQPTHVPFELVKGVRW